MLGGSVIFRLLTVECACSCRWCPLSLYPCLNPCLICPHCYSCSTPSFPVLSTWLSFVAQSEETKGWQSDRWLLIAIRIRLRRRSLCGQQTTGKGQQRGHRRRHGRFLRNHRGCPRSWPSVSCYESWVSLAEQFRLNLTLTDRLGSVHDGSPPPSYLGGPGAQRCRWEDGYIMSDLRHTERGFKWSSCSIAQFDHFLK